MTLPHVQEDETVSAAAAPRGRSSSLRGGSFVLLFLGPIYSLRVRQGRDSSARTAEARLHPGSQGRGRRVP